MKNTLMVVSVFLASLVLDVRMAFAEENDRNDEIGQNGEGGDGGEHGRGVPGPADSEAGLAGVLMAGAAAYLVSRRRKDRKA